MTDSDSKSSTNLILRAAEFETDIAFIRPLTLAFHEESHFGDIPLSVTKRDRLLHRALTDGDRFAVLIAAYDDRPVGFLYCSINEYVVGEIAREFRSSIIGARAAVRLLKGATMMVGHARRARGADPRHGGIDVQCADRFFRKAGFGVPGASYYLPLKADGTGA